MKKLTLFSLTALAVLTVFLIAGFATADKGAGSYATLVVREKINDVWSCEMVTVYENGTSEATELTKLKSGDIESSSKSITAHLNKLNAEGYVLISSCKGMNTANIITTYVFEKR